MNKTDQKLPDNFVVDIDGMEDSSYKIRVLQPKLIGEGRSVRVYQARVNLDEDTTKTMIIKELKVKSDENIESKSSINNLEDLFKGFNLIKEENKPVTDGMGEYGTGEYRNGAPKPVEIAPTISDDRTGKDLERMV